VKYLATFLAQFENLGSPSQGTAETAQSPPAASGATTGLACDDCGRVTSVAIVTDYGARYCRRCLREVACAS
jgi:ribosomal protein S14